ncbi:MAG TPA: hypothetical protein VF960_10335 [Chloroflexota bacterium]
MSEGLLCHLAGHDIDRYAPLGLPHGDAETVKQPWKEEFLAERPQGMLAVEEVVAPLGELNHPCSGEGLHRTGMLQRMVLM